MAKKPNLYDVFGSDKELEKEGVWIDYDEIGASFKIARMGGGNSAYARYLSNAIRPVKHQLETNTLSDGKAEEIYRNAFVNTILKDWSGVTDSKGKALPFTVENAIKLLSDLPHLHSELSKEAGNIENYQRKADEETAKNSEKSSVGN